VDVNDLVKKLMKYFVANILAISEYIFLEKMLLYVCKKMAISV
jgi:hypothetical protein